MQPSKLQRELYAMKPTPTLMIQGTTSDAGKTTLVAGLCRAFKTDGIAVAPFKPQNMALNSAVTADGGEIGRAQALQAIACGIEPHTDMNPVLLKPNSDTGAQVIIRGKAISNMQATRFHDYKAVAMEAVLSAYEALGQRHEMILVEGAGSPAEINLRANDIANMGFAEAVDCPVLLVADIDRGGVFAHLVGTLELLSASEQNRIKGFVINRFRGDIALLKPGLDWLEQRTGKPVLGVLPYLKSLYLDAEDAIQTQQQVTTSEQLNVVVPVMSRISNHTDFDALQLHPQVNLTFVDPSAPLPDADLIILSGTKNTRNDLEKMKQLGWQQKLNQHLRYGGKLLGICGGFQMLGQQVDDPLGIENKPGTSDGFGLLDFVTTLTEQKVLSRVSGTLKLGDAGGCDISGYEIHAGESSGPALTSPLVILDDQPDGAISEDQQIIGTYLHGLFDTPSAQAALLQWAGLNQQQLAIDLNQVREANIERLSASIREHLDMEQITHIIHNTQHK